MYRGNKGMCQGNKGMCQGNKGVFQGNNDNESWQQGYIYNRQQRQCTRNKGMNQCIIGIKSFTYH